MKINTNSIYLSMKKWFMILFLSLVASISFSQQQIKVIKEKIYKEDEVDVSAKYLNQEKLLQQFNPNDTTDCFQGGSLLINFIVLKDGTISNYKLDESSSIKCPSYINELIRILKKTSGKWKPAKIKNKNVSSYNQFGFRCLMPEE
jgi:hypothetical protein